MQSRGRWRMATSVAGVVRKENRSYTTNSSTSKMARESLSRNIIDGNLVQSFKCFSRREQEYIVRLCNKFLERNVLGQRAAADDLLLQCSAKGSGVSIEDVCSRIDAIGLLHNDS